MPDITEIGKITEITNVAIRKALFEIKLLLEYSIYKEDAKIKLTFLRFINKHIQITEYVSTSI